MTTSYATTTHLDQYGLPSASLGGVSSTVQEQALAAATSKVNSYLRALYASSLPLETPGDDIVQCVVHIATWDLLCRRGFNPQSTADAAARMRYEDALKWLGLVKAGSVVPEGLSLEDDIDDLDNDYGADSDTARNWT